ncbi:hypothetical protein Droror1_Dr00022142 [Drosera rotundifolia]
MQGVRRSSSNMEEMERRRVPAFGSWDYTDDLPFTQCFESARQTAAELRLRSYGYSEDRDLYVAGDLYDHNIVTPAVIIVPRRRPTKARSPQIKEAKKQEKGCGYGPKLEHPYSAHDDYRFSSSPPPARKFPKAIDEDLYKIPPELLYAKPRRKKGFGLFSSCLLPVCV